MHDLRMPATLWEDLNSVFFELERKIREISRREPLSLARN
jgi:hypothetical protein